MRLKVRGTKSTTTDSTTIMDCGKGFRWSMGICLMVLLFGSALYSIEVTQLRKKINYGTMIGYDAVSRSFQHMSVDDANSVRTNHTREDDCESRKTSPGDTTILPVTSNSTVCPPLLAFSTSSLWAHYWDNIVAASQMGRDRAYGLKETTETLLSLLSHRFPRAVQNLPRDWRLVQRILQKGWARYTYLQQSRRSGSDGASDEDSSAPPTVKILVLGGSVTMGVNCYTVVRPVNGIHCSWPTRLESFLNRLAGGQLVEVANHATGGTNSKIGDTLMRFELLPESSRTPDVIINGYSINDMHVISVTEAQKANMSRADYILEMQQNFARTALSFYACRPLVLFLDDYLGNEQREILATTEAGSTMSILAQYYGFGVISYSAVVRDLVYNNTQETLFSPPGWYKPPSPNMLREIHPLGTMHSTVAFSILYYFLDVATNFCGGIEAKLTKSEQTGNSTTMELDDYLLPPLTPESTLDVVSEDWRSGVKSSPAYCEAGGTLKTSCSFSWMSNINLHPDSSTATWIGKLFEPYLEVPKQGEAWFVADATGRKAKPGWSPSATSLGTPFVLNIPALASTTKVSFFIMKSYGEKWDNSVVSATLFKVSSGTSEPQLVGERTMNGFHDKQTSEVYAEEVVLTEMVAPTDTLKIQLVLKSGETFKVMGLAVCGD